MNRLFLSLVFGFIVIGGLLILQATRESASVVLLPSDLLQKHPSEILRRVRVAGTVSSLPVQYRVQPEISLAFHIEDPGDAERSVPVLYQGLKPDMFAPGRDVIIDGEYSGGVLRAAKLMTQCPSKYEPPTGHRQMSSASGEAEG